MKTQTPSMKINVQKDAGRDFIDNTKVVSESGCRFDAFKIGVEFLFCFVFFIYLKSSLCSVLCRRVS